MRVQEGDGGGLGKILLECDDGAARVWQLSVRNLAND